MTSQPAWKVILLNIVGGIIVNNLLSAAVALGASDPEPFRTSFWQTVGLAAFAGAVGGLVLSLSLRLYFPVVTLRRIMIITAIWTTLLAVIWIGAVGIATSVPSQNELSVPSIALLTILPPLAIGLGWALTSRLVNGYLTRLERGLMFGVVVVGALLNFLTLGGAFVLFQDARTGTITGMVVGGLIGLVMAQTMGGKPTPKKRRR